MAATSFFPLPPIGAWQLSGAHEGFEVARFAAGAASATGATGAAGAMLRGTSVGVEGGGPWSFTYVIEVDPAWRVRRAAIESGDGGRLEIEADGAGAWRVNGARRPELDGCFDLDLEGSAVTNTLPVHRLAIGLGERAEAPAAYVRTHGLSIERLEQSYRRLPSGADHLVFEYEAPRFEYRAELRFALDGLVVDYPGIARRVA